MSIEQGKEQISNKITSPAEKAKKAIENIQSLDKKVDIDTTFPRMKELMNIPGSEKTFGEISDISQICKGQNGAIDRKKMSHLCGAIDPESQT